MSQPKLEKSDCDTQRKAFRYENGQFVCHIYAEIQEHEKQLLEEVIQIVQRKRVCDNNVSKWRPICDNLNDDQLSDRPLHVTFLRGHRVVYYHQIKALVEAVQVECQLIKPFRVCLDSLKIFTNHEGNKQFLCICSCLDDDFFYQAKKRIQSKVDQFAIKLTDEDETESTVAHCSLLCRDVSNQEQVSETMLDELIQLIEKEFNEELVCVLNVNSIEIKIGNKIYHLSLSG